MPEMPILISRDILKMADDWEEIKKSIRPVPKEQSDACANAVREAMQESDEEIMQCIGEFLID
mgnify:CR=1 FL=1